VERLRHQERLERLAALNLDAQVKAMSHVCWGGGYETGGIKVTRGANKTKEKVMHEFAADELLKKRNALVETLGWEEKQLIFRTESTDFTLESTAVKGDGSNYVQKLLTESTTDLSLSSTTLETTISGETKPSLLSMPEGSSELFTRASPSDSQKRKESLSAYKAKFKSFTTKLDALVAAVRKDYNAGVEQREARAQVRTRMRRHRLYFLHTKEIILFLFRF
jgi:hypothetical protein